MTQLQQKLTLPAAMAQKLDVVRRRTFKVRFGTAIVAAIAVLLAAMALAMLVDWLATLYDFRWRAALTYTAWSTAGLTFLAWGVAAWRQTRRAENMASKVDREVPELEERWSTVTSLASSVNTSSSNGATNGKSSGVHPAMFNQVSSEAQGWTPRIEPERVVPLDGLIRALLFLTAITSVLGLAVLFNSQRTTVLLRRFWQPNTAISATELTDLSGDLVVGRGESLEIEANLVGAPVEHASLLLQPHDGEEKTISLIPRGDAKDQLNHRLRSVKDPLKYRLRAGDGQSPWYEVTVADRPKLANVRLTLTPPAYTRKEPTVINKLPRRVTVLEGSRVEISLKPLQELNSLRLKFGPELTEQLVADEHGWYHWRTTLSKNVTFQPLLTEKHGLDNLRPPTCELKVRPDRPPVVKILTPNAEMAVRPDDTIPVTFEASDDVGVHQAELVVYDESNLVNGKPTVLDRISVPLGEQQGAVKVKATVKLDLSQYETTDGAQLSFSIRVREDRGQLPAANETAANSEIASQTPPGNAADITADSTDSSEADPSELAANASPSDSEQAKSANDEPQAEQQDRQLADNPTPKDEPSVSQPANDQMASATPDQATASENEMQSLPSNDSNDSSAESLAENSSNSQSSPTATASNSQPANSNPANAQNQANPGEQQPANPASSEQPMKKPSGLDPNFDAIDQELTPTEADENAADPSKESRTTASSRQSLNTKSDSQTEDPSENDNSSAKKHLRDGNQNAKSNEAMSEDASDDASPQSSEDQATAGDPSNPTDPDQQPGNGQNQPSQSKPQSPSDSANKPMPEDNKQNQSSQQSGNRANSQSSESQPSEPQESTPSPGNPMKMRQLDTEKDKAAQSSSSQRMRLKIDEWAGSYDGQQREKLEIAIAPKLKALDRALEKAQTLSRAVLDDLDTKAGTDNAWTSEHERDIQRADEQIEAAIKIVENLENETYGTPYAFIGLQLVDINEAHISLARRDFWKSLQIQEAARVTSVRNGWQHTTRARELLVQLDERFVRTKTEYKMADAVQNIKKMYRVFVEDSMALLRPEGEGDRYRRKMAEFDLDEEYLKRLEEVLAMRNEMRAELARILADDPRLLRRFLDAQRNRGVVLRNDLDRIIEQQAELNRETRAWSTADEDDRPALAKILMGRHIESAQDISIAAADLHDRFETWSPLGKEADDPDFQATAQVLQEIATATSELSADGVNYVNDSKRAKKIEEDLDESDDEKDAAVSLFEGDEAIEQISDNAQQLYGHFTQLEVLLRKIGSREDRPDIAYFATNRLLETRRLVEQTSAWVRQLKQQQAGNYHRSAEVAQYRLAMATDSMAGKLADLEQTMAGLLQNDSGMLPESIATKARDLLTALDEQAAPNQLAAVYALRRNQMSRATSREESALAGLELAGKLYDEMIEASIIELDKLPVQDPIASLLDDPTLDDLLRDLEQELPINEALGIPRRPSNLQIMGDWLRSGGDNSLMTGGGGRMMMNQLRQQERMRQRQLDRAYRKAVARALKETEAEDLVTDMPKRARETADWNRLASQLEDDLRQGRDKAPPERYRRAIEQYFRQVSGAEDGDQ